jgi:hypothetical protein
MPSRTKNGKPTKRRIFLEFIGSQDRNLKTVSII